jgi:hypothetical protein
MPPTGEATDMLSMVSQSPSRTPTRSMRITMSAVLQKHDAHRDPGRFSSFFDLHGAGNVAGAIAGERSIIAAIHMGSCLHLPALLIVLYDRWYRAGLGRGSSRRGAPSRSLASRARPPSVVGGLNWASGQRHACRKRKITRGHVLDRGMGFLMGR